MEILEQAPPRPQLTRAELEEWMSQNGTAGHQVIRRPIGRLATTPNLTQQVIEELTQGD